MCSLDVLEVVGSIENMCERREFLRYIFLGFVKVMSSTKRYIWKIKIFIRDVFLGFCESGLGLCVLLVTESEAKTFLQEIQICWCLKHVWIERSFIMKHILK